MEKLELFEAMYEKDENKIKTCIANLDENLALEYNNAMEEMEKQKKSFPIILSKGYNTNTDIYVSAGFAATALSGELLYKYYPFWSWTKWVGLAIEIASYTGFPIYLVRVDRHDKLLLFLMSAAKLDAETIINNFDKNQFETIYLMILPWYAPISFLILFLPDQVGFIKKLAEFCCYVVTIIKTFDFLQKLYIKYFGN